MVAAILEQRPFIHHGYNHDRILLQVYPMGATLLDNNINPSWVPPSGALE